MKKSKMRGIAVNVALVVVALLIGIVFAEILLRLFFPQNLNITQLDQTKVFSHKPGIVSVLSRDEFATQVKISSQGLRDREFSVEKPEGTKRIAVLGDSFVFGFGVEQNQTFPKALERRLNEGGGKTRYEVMNFGVSAYSTEQEYLLLKEEVLPFHPDMVILSFYPNDLKENLRHNLFDVQEGELIQLPREPIGLSLKIRNVLSWHSHLYSLFYFSVIDRQVLSKALIRLNIINPQVQDYKPDFNVIIFDPKYTEEYKRELAKSFLLLEAMQKTLRENNITFVVLVGPTREQVDAGMMEKFIAENSIPLPVNQTRVQQDIIPWLGKQGIVAVDPLKDLRQRNTNNSFYFEIDGHWNQEGNELIGEVLDREITRRRLLS